MIVGYIGNFRHDHCTEVHIARSFQALGWDVVQFQEDERPPDWGRKWHERMRACDLVLYTRTWGLPAPAAQLLFKRLARDRIPTASFHLDLFFGLDRAHLVRTDPLFKTAYVFTADGGHEDEFRKAGVNHHWLRPGVVADECVPGRYRPEFDHDVVFVGSEDHYHLEWPWRRLLISWLRYTYGERFARYGPGNPDRTTRGQDLNDLYASAKVVVGDSLMLGPHYWSDRPYETVGRGGFLIQPRTPCGSLESELREQEHLDYYDVGNLDELRTVIDHWLAEPDERERVRKAGQEFVAAHCTYTQRVAEMLEVIGL